MQSSAPSAPRQGHVDVAGVRRIAAFSDGNTGGNPAGVWIGASLPEAAEMQRIAYAVGYSETAFAAPLAAATAATAATGTGAYRVRYFSPEAEVPFCGHATIALGAVLAGVKGDGVFDLALNDARITVEGRSEAASEGSATPLVSAALQSPPTRSAPAPADVVERALALFGYQHDDLDPRIAPALAHGGAG
ncbi:MAG TPA: hypothetical protein DDX04_03045, partial [Massilia sp.]|nr:hypothetical protein [Massilia sp.]